MFGSAGGCLFIRAKEAGKRAGMIDLLIRYAGTDTLAERDLYKSQGVSRNTYVYVADSAEQIADRREIHRRTVVINVAKIPDEESKGVALRMIESEAPNIIAALKRTIESKTPEWFLDQKNLDTRPVIPVALSRLFEVELPAVKGASLEELFDTMLDYIKNYSRDEGPTQQNKHRPNDGKASSAFLSYRLSHFLSVMRDQKGYEAVLENFPKPDDIINTIRRETDYDPSDRQKPHHDVEVRGYHYVFRLIRSNRNFVLVPDIPYYDKMGIPMPTRDDGPDDDLPFPPSPDEATPADSEQTASEPDGGDEDPAVPPDPDSSATGDERPPLKVVSS